MKPKGKKTKGVSVAEQARIEGEAFAQAMAKADRDGPLYHQLFNHFGEELEEALKARLCTRERMIVLYPILRQINLEDDQVEEEYYLEEAKEKLRRARYARAGQ